MIHWQRNQFVCDKYRTQLCLMLAISIDLPLDSHLKLFVSYMQTDSGALGISICMM